MNVLVNIALMQAVWFACVLGAAHHLPWLGVIAAVVVAAWHLLRTKRRNREATVLCAALVLGALLDSALVIGRVMTFSSGVLFENLTTPWMLALWLSFATTLTTSLGWLMQRPLLAITFGAVGGPIAYWSGERLGALALHPLALGLCAVGACWALAMGCFITLTKHLDATTASETPA